MDLNSVYISNADFKRYVDRYATKKNITPQIAITHAMIRGYAEWMKEQGKL